MSVLTPAVAFADTPTAAWTSTSKDSEAIAFDSLTYGFERYGRIDSCPTGGACIGDMVLATHPNIAGAPDGCAGLNRIEVDDYQQAKTAFYVSYQDNPNDPTSCLADKPATINLAGTFSDCAGDTSKCGQPSGTCNGNSTTCTTTTAPQAASGDECPIDPNDGLRWILCPLVDAGILAIKAINAILDNFLYVPTDQFFGNGSAAQGLQTVYNTFRDIGLSLLVIAGLVMVASQAAGLEMFSAHTIRKALPRIVMAAIGMSLAWPIMQFVVTFFNDLGTWMAQIIVTTTIPANAGTSFGGIGDAIATIFGSVLAIAVTLAWMGGPAFLSLIGTILLVLLVALIVLALRQLVILLCILLAPLAIAAAVLPGTEKLWKFWRDTLLGALFMFPIITGFLAAGAAVAHIASAEANASPNPVGHSAWDLMAVVVFFAPYFFLPFSFRLASGLVGNIFGLVHDTNKGWFDRLRKTRDEARAARGHLWRAGSLYPNRGLGRVINNVGRRTNAGWRGRFGFGETGRTALALGSASEVERTLKGNPHLAQLANDDDANAVLGLSGGSRTGAILAARRLFTDRTTGVFDRIRADRAVAAASAIGFNRSNATAALTTMAQNKSRAVAAGDIGAVQEGINRLAGGNMALANSLAFGYQFNSRQAGRFDLGGAWHTGGTRTSAEAMQRNAVAAGAPAADLSMDRAASMATMLDGFSRSELSSIMRAHDNTLKAGLDSIDYALKYGTADQKITAGHHILELQSGLPYATESNKEAINRWMEDHNYHVYEDRPSLAKQVADVLVNTYHLPASTTRVGYGGADAATIARALDAEARVYSQEAYRQGVNPY